MNNRQDRYLQAVVNYGIRMADTDRVGACKYMLECGVSNDTIVRVLSHPERRRK